MKSPTGVKVSAVSFWGPTRAAWTSPDGAAKGALSAAEPVGAADGGRVAAPVDGGRGGSFMAADTFETFKQRAERAFLLAKLREHDWNVSETARTLDMPRSNLYKKIDRYGLAREAT